MLCLQFFLEKVLCQSGVVDLEHPGVLVHSHPELLEVAFEDVFEEGVDEGLEHAVDLLGVGGLEVEEVLA